MQINKQGFFLFGKNLHLIWPKQKVTLKFQTELWESNFRTLFQDAFAKISKTLTEKVIASTL